MSEPVSTLDTRPSLLVRLRDAQDRESWELFVDVYGPLIFRYLRERRLQDADAADVGQEVLAQLARSIRNFTYRPERGRFRDWLRAVTRQKLCDFLNKRRPTVSAVDLEQLAGEPAEEAWTAAFHAHVLEVALKRIRPHFEEATWRVFELSWIENRTASEAASLAQVPIAAVYVAKSRVLKRLRGEVLLLAEDMPFG